MNQWEYLEVKVDLSKKTWKDSEGRRGKLRRNSVSLALNELGIEGWELAASMSENGTAHRLLFKRPWIDDGADDADDSEDGDATGDAEDADDAAEAAGHPGTRPAD